MIDEVLQKFTLSEARRSNKTRIDIHKTPAKSTQKPDSHKVSSFNMSCQHRTHSPAPFRQTYTPKNKLERMIEYLKQNQSQRCSVKQHEASKIRYLCLDDGCRSSFGCAYCFLHSHAGHRKAEIDICVRDIHDLNSLLNKSYDKITNVKMQLRNEILKEIDLQINNLINDFHSNLQYLKKYSQPYFSKAIKEIDSILLQESTPLTNLHEVYPIKEEQEDLLTEIIRLDVKGIQRDLWEHLQNAQNQKVETVPVIRFFQNLNSTLGHCLAEFKQFFPKLNHLSQADHLLPQVRNKEVQDLKFDDRLFEDVAFESPHFQS